MKINSWEILIIKNERYFLYANLLSFYQEWIG